MDFLVIRLEGRKTFKTLKKDVDGRGGIRYLPVGLPAETHLPCVDGPSTPKRKN